MTQLQGPDPELNSIPLDANNALFPTKPELEFKLSERDWEHLKSIADLPDIIEEAKQTIDVRALLERQNELFRISINAFIRTAPIATVKSQLRKIANAKIGSSMPMDMHPEVKSLLAGMAWRDSSIGSADMANLNRAWQEVAETAYITKEMKEWAQWCLRCGSGARPHFRTTGGSQDVPDQLLIRALMNIWRDRLKRPLTNWAQERRDFTLNASQLTKFVGAFLSIVGACPRNKPLSPQAIRQRIRRAKKLMD